MRTKIASDSSQKNIDHSNPTSLQIDQHPMRIPKGEFEFAGGGKCRRKTPTTMSNTYYTLTHLRFQMWSKSN